ncbi:carbohydrate ABC transporter substrate-binding protein (CUT1 family) [Paramicrobacterium agarici]|nr:carbohydrate ABC transporter substrate-binding protein (CUT1 family) [Microbacterium agarici]
MKRITMKQGVRAVGAVAAIGLAGGLLTGCNSGGGPGPNGYDLTVWVYSDFVQGEAGELMDKLVEEFKDEHDNVNSVTLEPKNDAELLNSLMSGVGLPDAFSASARDGKEYRAAIDLLDLSSVFESTDYADGFYQDALDAVSVDDGVWAIPFISYIPVIYRNLTVLEKAGVNPDEGIPTYDAFLDQLEKVDASGTDATHSWTNNSYFAPGAVMGSDAENITVGVEDGETTIEPSQLERTFETVAAIEQFANQSMTNDSDVAVEAFKSDRLGYLVGGPWQEANFEQSGVEYDFVLVPPYEEGGWTGGLQGWDFFYGVSSGDDERDALVSALLQQIGSYEFQKQWTIEVGRSTLREDVMDDPEVISASTMAEVSSEGLKNGMLQMDFMRSSVFWPSAMADPVAKLGTGKLTPEEAAERFVEGINQLYNEAGE